MLVAVRDYHRMEHLKRVLEKTNLRRHDIVVMTVRPISTGAGEYDLSDEQIFSDYEKELFSHVVEMAEKEGKPVELLVVPAVNPFDAHGAGGQQPEGVAPGYRRQRAHGIGGTGAAASAWPGRALPEPRHSVLARSDQPGPAVDLCEPGSASAAHVAGRRGSAARNLAGAERVRTRSAPACIIATWWASRCGGCRRI